MYYRIKTEWPQAKGIITTRYSAGFHDRTMAESAAAGHAKQGAVSVELIRQPETKEDMLRELNEMAVVLNMIIKGSNSEKEFDKNTGLLNCIAECIAYFEETML